MKIDFADFIDRLGISNTTFDRENPKPRMELEFYDRKLNSFVKRIEILGIHGRSIFYRYSGKFEISTWKVSKNQRWVMAVRPPRRKGSTLIQVGRYDES